MSSRAAPQTTKSVPVSKPTRLNSWKQIADYLGRGTRTVQRWHSTLGLPVHKMHATSRSEVFAYKTELDRWLRQCAERDERQAAVLEQDRINNPRALRAVSVMKEMTSLASQQYDKVAVLSENVRRMVEQQKQRQQDLAKQAYTKRERMEQVGFTFLVSDLELARTLTRIAANSGRDTNKRKRNQQNARRAYDSVETLARRAVLTGSQRAELNDVAAKLKSELQKLGEVF